MLLHTRPILFLIWLPKNSVKARFSVVYLDAPDFCILWIDIHGVSFGYWKFLLYLNVQPLYSTFFIPVFISSVCCLASSYLYSRPYFWSSCLYPATEVINLSRISSVCVCVVHERDLLLLYRRHSYLPCFLQVIFPYVQIIYFVIS
jgi:hypothetical protein